ncbi:AMP-binding protein [Leifsonia sp. L25]|uniref:AMP-binding protein n=1 Tax=Leifsonia sp. L25 TaxID=3423957 RepID=UPI003D6920FB
MAQNVALVIETSGSTGVPKRVALSADALLASAAASAGALGGQGQWLLALPAHYVAGAQVLIRSLAAETEPVQYGEGHFDAERFADAADRLDHDLRYTSLVPAQLARLVERAEGGSRRVAAALRRFDGILVGGQALSPSLRDRAERLGARVTATYGSSETAGGCVYDGVPIGTTLVRASDGQLEISGPVLAEGYLGDPERTARAFHEADGVRWYRTGDLGEVSAEGRVSVFGRSDNVIISGGRRCCWMPWSARCTRSPASNRRSWWARGIPSGGGPGGRDGGRCAATPGRAAPGRRRPVGPGCGAGPCGRTGAHAAAGEREAGPGRRGGARRGRRR